MSYAIEINSLMASNHDDHKNHFHAIHDEATSQPSTTASSPFNSFIVEYDIGAVNLYHHGSKEPNIRLKELTLSGEQGQPKSVFSRHTNNRAMQTPPAKLIGEYDPNRIPGTAFCNKNAGHDWSVASNESLFSIQMGNASFNRDHPTFFRKSQELPKFDDMMNHSSRLPPLYDATRENTNMNGKQDLLLHHDPSVVLSGTMEDPRKEASKGTGERLSAELSSIHSNGSNSGVPAFSFPILDNAVDTRNSLGKLNHAEINKQKSYLETSEAAPNNDIAMNSPVAAAAAAATATVKPTCWFSIPCCRAGLLDFSR